MTILALAAYFVMGYFVGRRVSRPQPLQQAERQVIRRAVDAIRAVEEKRKWCMMVEKRLNGGLKGIALSCFIVGLVLGR